MSEQTIATRLYRVLLNKEKIDSVGAPLKENEVVASNISPLLRGMAFREFQIMEGLNLTLDEFMAKFMSRIVHNTSLDDKADNAKTYKDLKYLYFNPCPQASGRYVNKQNKWVYPNGHYQCLLKRREYNAILVCQIDEGLKNDLASSDEFQGLRKVFVTPINKIIRIMPALSRHIDQTVYRRPKDLTIIPEFEPLKIDSKSKAFKKIKSAERNFLFKLAKSSDIPDLWLEPKSPLRLKVYY